MIKRYIKVSFQKEGVHYYPEALTDPNLKTDDWDDVSFLGHPHRHIFHFYITMEVRHNQRDIEFIQFKRWLERLYDTKTLYLDYKSCEMLAEELLEQIKSNYEFDIKYIKVEVYEDDENGGIIEYVR